jgi:repressor LexA
LIDRDMPLKKEISYNLKKILKDRGITQLKLSEMSGISKSTLSDYINCRTLINPGNVEKLSNALNIEKSKIDPSFKTSNATVVNEPAAEYKVNNSAFSRIPIVGSISCGNGVIAYEEIEGYEETPKSWLNGGEHFYLRAKGDSMINARIEDGDLLLIRIQEEVENGEIAAVLIDGEAVLKRVHITDGSMFLQSENPKYPPKLVKRNSDVKILGKLKRTVITF